MPFNCLDELDFLTVLEHLAVHYYILYFPDVFPFGFNIYAMIGDLTNILDQLREG